MQCPKCGSFNPEGFSSCAICGKSLQEDTGDAFPSAAAAAPRPSFQTANSPPLRVRFETSSSRSLEQISGGQKLILYAILANLVTLLLVGVLGELAGSLLLVVQVAAGAIAILGLVKVASGLGYSVGARVLLILAAFIPLLNLAMLVLINARATKILRAAGYKVGLLGAHART